jgi:hypothetical protein
MGESVQIVKGTKTTTVEEFPMCTKELGQTNNKNRPKSKSKYITLKTPFESR